ncbi:unnamed protein product, partial [marine sediment metagenome]
MGDIEFGDLKMPFACVATDIITSEEVVIKQGLVWEGIRASVSIPVILAVARREGRYLVDGALTNPVPVSVLREMGADFIIAGNTMSDRSKSLKPVSKKPNIFSVIMQTIHIVAYQSLKSSLAGADVVIEPQVASIGYFDFHQYAVGIFIHNRSQLLHQLVDTGLVKLIPEHRCLLLAQVLTLVSVASCLQYPTQFRLSEVG